VVVEDGGVSVGGSGGRRADAGALPSIGTVGDSYDNALAETIIGLYKAELVHWQGPWRGADHLELATLD
jgi:putative transposase